MWIRKEGAFTGVVPVATFMTAQEILAERSRKLTDQELLEHLKRLYAECGSLSGFIINQALGRATASMYSQRFGCLSRAYQLVISVVLARCHTLVGNTLRAAAIT